jgi:TonB-dependent SusC/RagA subfamily outer membrane receptor
VLPFKDAAALSIYGSRAANGVILVTTRRGEKDRNVITVMLCVQEATVKTKFLWIRSCNFNQ